jgi:cysteine-rich repeat protein
VVPRLAVVLVAVVVAACGGEPASQECGDGIAQGSEGCDGADLRGATCETLGFNAGTLTCHAACVPDLRGCQLVEVCGNGVDDDGNGDKDCDDEACAGACAVCGDGAVTGGETCDDGNTDGGDCCDGACQVETGCEVEPNDTLAQAALVGDEVRGSLPPDDVDVFRVDVPVGQTATITAEVHDGAISLCRQDLDTVVDLVSQAGVVLASDHDGGEGTCSRTVGTGLPSGPVFIVVRRGSGGGTFDYRLSVSVELSPCGDGTRDQGQLCDDGNTTGGDGCSATCQLEPASEQEPNSTNQLAQGPFAVPFAIRGEVTASDADVFAVDLPGWAELRVETFDASGPPHCVDADTLVIVNGYADNDNGPGLCSLLPSGSGPIVGGEGGASPLPQLPPGRIFIEVRSPQRSVSFGYTLYVTYISLCGDGVVEGSEECDGTADCTARCAIDRCGDGEVGIGESCDDGGRVPDDGCDAACQREPGCGDGEITSGEQCDDNNRGAGDCCSATCQAEDGCEIEAVDVTPMVVPGEIKGAIFSDYDTDTFSFTVDQAVDVRLETFDATGVTCQGLDLFMVITSDSDNVFFLSDAQGGVDNCALVQGRLPPGAYHLLIQAHQPAEQPPRTYLVRALFTAVCGDNVVEGSEECEGGAGCQDCLLVPVCGDGSLEPPEECDDGNPDPDDGCDGACHREPACGDGFLDMFEQCDDGNPDDGDGCDVSCQIERRCGNRILEELEQCDDGNPDDGDGCDATCAVEPGHLFEEEPNDDGSPSINTDDFIAVVSPVLSADVTIHAALSVPGDEDVFAVTNPGATTVVTAALMTSPDGACAGIDTQLLVRSSSGARVGFDDDSGDGFCSLATIPLAAGQTLYLQVRDFGDNTIIPSYLLRLTFGASGP